MLELIKRWHEAEPDCVKLRTSYGEIRYVLNPSGRPLSVDGKALEENVFFAVLECIEHRKISAYIDISYGGIYNAEVSDVTLDFYEYGPSPGYALLAAYLEYLEYINSQEKAEVSE